MISSSKYFFISISFFYFLPLSASIDIGVVAILNPESGFDLGGELITIQIENFGDESISDFNVYFMVDGGAVYGEEVLYSIEPGESAEFTFLPFVDFSALGPHTMCAWTIVEGDIFSLNDSTCSEVIALKIVDLGNDSITSCGSVILDAENIGTNYLWSTGEITSSITVTESGIYWVNVLELLSGISDSDTIEVVIELTPVASFIFTNDALTYSFTNTSIGDGTYLWDFGDGDISIEENPVHLFTSSSMFIVSLSATNVCGTASKEVEISASTSIHNQWAHPQQFLINPNPVSDMIYLDDRFNFEQIEIYHASGEKISFDFNVSGIDISDLPSGIYVVKCGNKIGQFTICK